MGIKFSDKHIANFIFHTILQEEYKHLQASSVNSSGGNSNSSASASTGPNNSSQHSGLPVHSPHTGNGMVPTSEAEIIHEAKMLREHKDRLNSRMKLLEVHNSQLEMQLGKLRQLLNAPGGSCSTSSSENNSSGVSYREKKDNSKGRLIGNIDGCSMRRLGVAVRVLQKMTVPG